MMDLISIIIPVYNAELFLDECIKSLIKQTYKNLEIIFIDDGSKDESKKIIEKYLNIDSRIKYFYKENGGACSARNKGLEEMTGEYVCFVDSDDYVENDYVNKLYSSIKENKANIACCNFSRVNEKCKKIIKQTPQDHWSFELPSLCNKLFDAKLFKDFFIPTGFKFEDNAILPILFFKAEKISFVDDSLYNYRENHLSVMNKMDRSVLDIKKALEFLYNYCHYHNLFVARQDIIEYIFLYDMLDTVFRISLCDELSVKDIKEYCLWTESVMPNLYQNKIGKDRFGILRKNMLVLIKHRMYSVCRFIIRILK